MLRRTALLAIAATLLSPAALGAGTPVWKAWLCGPHAKPDFCNVQLTTTVVHADGSRTFSNPSKPPNPPVDCFYVYPTVSTEKRGNSDLRVKDEEALAALMQGGEFEQTCRVYAPMYRQVTAYAGTNGIPQGSDKLAYQDVLAAWRDYLAHDNHGRGVVFLGHSQGSFILEHLLRAEYAQIKKVLVSAILVGGNIQVTNDHFGPVPACRSFTQTGCIAGWSTWDRTPPKDAAFEDVTGKSAHILCVNPAAPAGGSAPITPLFTVFSADGIVTHQLKPKVKTFWISFPDLYTARCVEQGQRAWLLVTRLQHPGDSRETVRDFGNPTWGLHAADLNIALTEAVALVRQQAKSYVASH